jgi:hypothetical protein
VTRGTLALVGVLTVPGAANASAIPTTWPPPHCPSAHALVAYYVSDGFTFNNDLVIRRDRHASLCWGRHIHNRSGRTNFLVSRHMMQALAVQLGRIGVGRLGPPRQPRCCDIPSASLIYKGTTIPADGYPKSQAGIRALRQAEKILDGILHRRAPP